MTAAMGNNLAKLKALRERVIQVQELHSNIEAALFVSMREQFFKEAERLKETHADLRDFIPQIYEQMMASKEYYYKWATRALVSDIEYFINYMTHLESVQMPSVVVSEEGVFLAGEHFDALLKINELVMKATSEIVLIDNYVDGKLIDLLGAKSVGVKCRVLTKSSAITPGLRIFVTAFNGQYGGLEVRSSAVFHDRFLVLDRNHFYHFGASLKDAGRKGFMFSRIEQQSLTAQLWKEFETEWAATGPSVV